MFFDDPNRHGDPYGLWQLLQEQEKKRQQELLQQQQYLQSPFGQPAQPPEPQGFGHAPSDPSGYGTPRHGLGIPTNVRDLPTTIADLPDMSEAQVRALDKDVYNELFGDANASLVPAWIKIEKMERRKREAAQAAAAQNESPISSRNTSRIGGGFPQMNPIGSGLQYANATGRTALAQAQQGESGSGRKTYEEMTDEDKKQLYQDAWEIGRNGFLFENFIEFAESKYDTSTFSSFYMDALEENWQRGRDEFIDKDTWRI